MSNRIVEIVHTKEKSKIPEISKSKISMKLLLELIAAASIVFSIIWEVRVEKQKDEWLKKVETLHTLEARDRKPIKYINNRIKTIPDDSILTTILSDSLLLTNVKQQLVIFEDISIGCNIGIYDKEVLKKFIGKSFIDFNMKMQPYISYARKLNQNPSLDMEYDECVKSILGDN